MVNALTACFWALTVEREVDGELDGELRVILLSQKVRRSKDLVLILRLRTK